ncbi:MAG: hypothetical protein FWD51_07610 [Betaproteobacteria bacterium]|nr:hypothetical protein [Betaproteobacteria bacterium]
MSLKQRLPVFVAALLAILIAVLAGTADREEHSDVGQKVETTASVNQEAEATVGDNPEDILSWMAEEQEADSATEESWLMDSERAGGHLLARHVGQSESELANRLKKEPNISAASTYETTEQAEEAVLTAFEVNAPKLENWLSKGANGRLTLDAAFPGGIVMKRGATTATQGTGVRIVLQGNGQGSFYILTGYPTP